MYVGPCKTSHCAINAPGEVGELRLRVGSRNGMHGMGLLACGTSSTPLRDRLFCPEVMHLSSNQACGPLRRSHLHLLAQNGRKPQGPVAVVYVARPLWLDILLLNVDAGAKPLSFTSLSSRLPSRWLRFLILPLHFENGCRVFVINL